MEFIPAPWFDKSLAKRFGDHCVKWIPSLRTFSLCSISPKPLFLNPDDGPSRMFHATKEEGEKWPLYRQGPTAIQR